MALNKSLTVKQTKFVKAYIANDGNGKLAYKAAYGVTNDNTAAAEASTTLKKPNVQEAIDAALVKHGITIESATKPIADGLKATDEVVIDGKVLSKKPDHSTRLRASAMALKLLGADKGETQTPSTVNFIKNANFNSKDYVK